MASVMQAHVASDPLAEALAGFGTRHARYDSAFFKLNVPEMHMALLVEIVRLRRNRRQVIEVRASLFTPDFAAVHSATFPGDGLRFEEGNAFVVGNLWFSPQGARGTVGPITWDLVFEANGALLDPQVVGSIRPFDLRLIACPDTLVSGNVSLNQHGYSFSHEPGALGSIYGRRLPDRWHWISANAFARPSVTLDCMIMDSTVFGIPFLRARVGYFHLRTPEQTLTLLHPLTSQVRINGSREEFTLTVQPRHGDAIHVYCKTPATRFHHIADNVFTALLGTCAIDGVSIASGAAGITERRMSRSSQPSGVR